MAVYVSGAGGVCRHVTVAIEDRIATITITRPDTHNAIDQQTATELTRAIERIAVSDDAGVLIVTGAGANAFSAGADIAELQHWGRDQGLAGVRSRLYRMLETCPKPSIAAVNGLAVGGGCELALSCDLRIAAAHARFGQPEVTLGIIPAAGATQRLPRIVGAGRAKHLVLTGQLIDAATALSWGLVSSVVPADALMGEARRLASEILTRSPLALRLAKLALDASMTTGLDAGLTIESLAQAICFESTEKAEATRAFLDRRRARTRS
jgi:enoyl-CoA hydratase/carnithine racemase